MTALLTVAAAISTLILLVSATNAVSRATASDPHRRGPWGITSWTFDRSRPLNPHERRWQTTLLSARENDTRWSDLVAEIEKLQRLSNITPTTPAPAKRDNAWLDRSISALESASATETGDPTA